MSHTMTRSQERIADGELRDAQNLALCQTPPSKDPSTQMNVRMGKALHDQGVAAFAEIGISPSEAVRALWRKAAQGGKNLEEVRTLLFPTMDASKAAEDLLVVEEGQRIVEDGLRKLGIETSGWPLEGFPSYESIEEMARAEKLAKEGLL